MVKNCKYMYTIGKPLLLTCNSHHWKAHIIPLYLTVLKKHASSKTLCHGCNGASIKTFTYQNASYSFGGKLLLWNVLQGIAISTSVLLKCSSHVLFQPINHLNFWILTRITFILKTVRMPQAPFHTSLLLVCTVSFMSVVIVKQLNR